MGLAAARFVEAQSAGGLQAEVEEVWPPEEHNCFVLSIGPGSQQLQPKRATKKCLQGLHEGHLLGHQVRAHKLAHDCVDIDVLKHSSFCNKKYPR